MALMIAPGYFPESLPDVLTGTIARIVPFREHPIRIFDEALFCLYSLKQIPKTISIQKKYAEFPIRNTLWDSGKNPEFSYKLHHIAFPACFTIRMFIN
jgi:hypothetical protein